MDLKDAIQAFRPWNEQEEHDRDVMLELLGSGAELFTRQNRTAHFTASSWIVDAEKTHVLMAYHRIYRAWAWTGGHADGEKDLLAVALREANEETGVHAKALSTDIFSLEILTVDGHVKKGAYVPSHLHLNITYLLEADKNEPLLVKPDENDAVRWFTKEDALKNCREEWMVERIYSKLNEKLLKCF